MSLAPMSRAEAEATMAEVRRAIDELRQRYHPGIAMIFLVGCATEHQVDHNYLLSSSASGQIDELAVLLRDGLPRIVQELKERSDALLGASAPS